MKLYLEEKVWRGSCQTALMLLSGFSKCALFFFSLFSFSMSLDRIQISALYVTLRSHTMPIITETATGWRMSSTRETAEENSHGGSL